MGRDNGKVPIRGKSSGYSKNISPLLERCFGNPDLKELVPVPPLAELPASGSSIIDLLEMVAMGHNAILYKAALY